MVRKEAQRVNFSMLLKVMGWLLMIESGFMAFPLIASIYYKEPEWLPIGGCTLVTLIIGFCLRQWIHPSTSHMGKRDGFLLTAMVWVVFSFFGMLPLLFGRAPLSITDAFMESMGGFTTTGVSLYPEGVCPSHGINLWRALMQWIGGMGIILFTLAVLPMLNSSGGMQMFNAEVTGITHEKIRPRISQTAKRLWLVYIVLTGLCAALLMIGPMTGFDSICHALGTVSTGGFSTHAGGINDWDSAYIYIIIIIFMFLGGTSFSMIYYLATGKWTFVSRNSIMRVYVGVALGATLVFILSIWVHKGIDDWRDATIYPLFQVVSTLTSTGYTLSHVYLWGPMVITLIVPLMLCGGCAGSTSGGVKIDRVVVLSIYVRNSIKRALQPNNITSVKIDGRVLPPDVVSKVVAFICLYFIIACTGALVLASMDVDIIDSFFCSLSCMTNLGIGADITGMGKGISCIPAAGRWILSFLMLVGRLEIFTVLLIFTPNFWHK